MISLKSKFHMRILIDINLDNYVYFHFGQNLIALQLYKLDFLFVVLSILSILKIFMRFVNNGLFDQLHIPIHVHQKCSVCHEKIHQPSSCYWGLKAATMATTMRTSKKQ